jgi:hypothetical protein
MNKIIVSCARVPLLCKIQHSWKFHHTTGCNRYSICSRCKARMVTWYIGGYQPVDMEWLKGAAK